MATSLTHKYIPRIQQVEENLFIEEYYSSTDVKIYIEGVEQTEISYINYSLQEQLKPLYGYSSNTFDDVAIGNRIVTGILKTPINNVNTNSTEEDINERSKDSNYGYIAPDILDYNTNQEIGAGAIDWIGNTEKTPSTSTPKNRTEEEYEYITKLMSLGYDININCSEEMFSKFLKQFQQDSGSSQISGELDYFTKKLIDQQTSYDNVIITVPKGTVMYSGPSTELGTTGKFNNEAKVGIIEELEGGWKRVILINNNLEAYINLGE